MLWFALHFSLSDFFFLMHRMIYSHWKWFSALSLSYLSSLYTGKGPCFPAIPFVYLCDWDKQHLTSSILWAHRPCGSKTEYGWTWNKNLYKEKIPADFLAESARLNSIRFKQIRCSEFMNLLGNFIQGRHHEGQNKHVESDQKRNLDDTMWGSHNR